jgi:hypothetical protein
MSLAKHALWIQVSAILAFALGAQAQDAFWTFSNNGLSDFKLTAVSTTDLFSGSLPANDPTINLVVGNRYQVTVVLFNSHPLQIIAKGAGGDTVLLSKMAGPGFDGTLEGDAGINWVDGAIGEATFTMTQTLLDAMTTSGHVPGYRCGVHSSTMRGDFNVTGGAPANTPTITNTPSDTATPTETSTQTATATPTDTAGAPPATATPSNTPKSADLSGDGKVDSNDLLEFIRQWRSNSMK